MKAIIFSIPLFTALVCQPALANNVSFVAKIEDILVNRSVMNDDSELIRAEKISIDGENPCDNSVIYTNAESLSLKHDDYMAFIQSLWQQAQDDKYFLFTTAECGKQASKIATKIEACNEKICDAKYITEDNIIWIGGSIADFEILNRKDAILSANYFFRLPLTLDKEKNLWKVTGWFLGEDLDTSGEGKLKAFEGYTNTEDFSSQKFISNFTGYYATGEKSVAASFNQQGLLDGEFTAWHKNGNKHENYYFVNGKREGEYIELNENGTIANKSQFKDDKHIDGPCNHYDSNGGLNREHSYRNGRYDGKYVDYYSPGKPKVEKYYREGNVLGEQKEYFENGKIKTVSHFDDQGRYDGIHEAYTESGVLISRDVYNHSMNISSEKWYPTGKQQYLQQHDENGKNHGDTKKWAENGQLIQHIKYEHNNIIFEKEWAENGSPLTEATYKQGSEDHIQKLWSRETGQLIEEASYGRTQLSGPTKKWDEKSGKLILETNYKNGIEDGLRKDYDPQTGELIQEQWSANFSILPHYVNNSPSLQKYKDGKLITAGCDMAMLLDNPEEAKEQATNGIADSQVKLGFYYKGCSMHKEAESWMLKAAEQKNSDALYYLSQLYLLGEKDVIPRDSAKHLQYLIQAAEAGNSDAQFYSGAKLLPEDICGVLMSSCNAKSRFAKSDLDKALYWLNKAAEQQDTQALLTLGSIFGYGIGVQKDTEKALRYYQILEKESPEIAKNKIDELNAHNVSNNNKS